MVGRSALAEFIQKLMPSKAHWYAIIQPGSEEPNSSLIHSVFPAMSDLLSLDDEVWRTMLVHLGLATYWRGKICTPLMASWERFIGEFQLNVEVTRFKIGARQRLLLRIGSWNQKHHPVKRPADIWSKAIQNGFYDTPKLRISSLSMRFALAIAELGFDVRGHQECSNDIIFAEEDDTTEEINGYTEETPVVVVSKSDFSSDEFPLLHSSGLHSKKHMDSLIREVVKYDDCKAIKYVQANNCNGFLLPLSSCQTLEQYMVEFGK
jgi:hypothetical protein